MKLNFLMILTLVFIAAKLFNYVDWSWWLVFSPYIINIVCVIIVSIDEVVNGKRRKK